MAITTTTQSKQPWPPRSNWKLITKLKLRRMLPIMQFDKPSRRPTIKPALDQY